MLINTPQQNQTRFGFASGSSLANTNTGGVARYFAANGKPFQAPKTGLPQLPTITVGENDPSNNPCNCNKNNHYAVLAAVAIVSGLAGYFIAKN